MDALKALESRKSCRSYLDKAVEADKIETLVKAGNNAPKAGPFQISVITLPACLKEINDKALEGMKNSGVPFLMERAALPGYQPGYGAPALFMISAPGENPFSMANAANAATNITIAATALGLGSCWVMTATLGLKADADLAKRVGLPEGFQAMCGVLVGYPGEEKFAAPKETLNNVNYIR